MASLSRVGPRRLALRVTPARPGGSPSALLVRCFMVKCPDTGEARMVGTPHKQGLYDPSMEKDSCGTGFIVDIKGAWGEARGAGASAVCACAHRQLLGWGGGKAR